jgi:hypothetical protein
MGVRKRDGVRKIMYKNTRVRDYHKKLIISILGLFLIFTGLVIPVSGANPTITVSAPIAEENWQMGRTKTITWASSGAVGSTVDIELYRAGVFDSNIVYATSNDGSHSWSISTSIEADVNYQIKITSSTDGSIYDLSDAYFSIGLNKLTFSGYTWRVRDTQTASQGPGPNYFSSSPENVWLDAQGQLHLKITYRNGIWYCGEIYSEESFGYGLYTFFAASRVDTIDINGVIGLFTYLDDNNEIDIEFSRWGWESGTNAGFTCQPWQTAGNSHAFDMSLSGNYSTHNFNWQAGEIKYRSLYGHYYEPPNPSQIIQTWNYTGPDIPPESTERAHINLWLMSGLPPSDGQEIEVVIKEFNFTDLSSVPTLSPQPGFSSPVNNSIVNSGDTVTFDWQDIDPITGNIHYQLEWTQDPYDTDSLGYYNTGGSWTGNISEYSVVLNTPGNWFYHVYAYDDGGEFGELSDAPGPWDNDFVMIPDIPAPPKELIAELYPPGSLNDVRLTWNASSDDGSGDNDVGEYVIYRSSDISGPYTNLGSVLADGSSTYSYTDSAAGDGDFTNYFYRVHSKDDQGKERQNEGRAAKWTTYLESGWNVFALPLVTESTSRSDVLSTIDGNYLAIQSYQGGKSQPWLNWHRQKPAQFNDDFEISYGKGYYINMENPDYLVVAGSVDLAEDVALKKGWNFVGNPSMSTQNIIDLNLPGEVGYIEHNDISSGSNSMKSYDPASQSGDLLQFDNGEAYWIHSNADATWSWSNRIYEQPEPQNWEDIDLWWNDLVDISVGIWKLDDPYFVASLVKKESWFNASAYNAAEKVSYESGDDNWFGEYYGKGLMQITGSWIAGVPLPNSTDWTYNMPPTAIYEEAPELLDAYNGSQNLNRGIWYIKALLKYYNNDQYKVATAYRYGWQGLDNGDYDPYNNGYILDVFGYKKEYLDNLGISEGEYPNNG